MLITERLYLRPLEREDYPALRRQLQDPQVMYAYEHGFTDREVGEWLNRQLRRYEENGFGLWAVERRTPGASVQNRQYSLDTGGGSYRPAPS